MIVEVIPYDKSWPQKFDIETNILKTTLGNVAVQIHHIGSTAVPGLAAKPIIDILLEVNSLESLDAMNDRMINIGYSPRGELGIPRRRYFSKGGDERTHQIHAFILGDPHVFRHLAFRDYLRGHPDTAKEYGLLKLTIAKICDNDIEKYCDGKDEYVKRLEAIAITASKMHLTSR